MTTCIHMAILPVHGSDETMDYCMLSDKLCLLVSGNPCKAQEESEGE